jgi:triacylglycerol esterase/lipase EstA (alpha/beta hydrolase family)
MFTAITLGALIVVGCAAYVAAAFAAAAHGVSPWWFVLGLPLAWYAIPFLFTVLWFSLAWRFGARRPEDVRLTSAERLHMFWREMRALSRSAPRMALYRLLMRDPPPGAAAVPVLLVHGVMCNAGVWYGFRRRLAVLGISPIYAMSYGPPLASIERFADQLAEKIDVVLASTGARDVVIVAHSMGGLVSRAYLRRRGGAKVRRLITIGAPHRGSMHARFFPGQSLAEMRPDNAWLDELNVERAQGVPVVSLWSWHDSMVTPQTSSYLDWAENVVLTGIGHNALLDDDVVAERVAAEIRRAKADDEQGERAPKPAGPTSESPASAERTPSAPA